MCYIKALTKIKHFPKIICMLKYLKILEVKSYWLLEKLPENLGQLQWLEKLILTECFYEISQTAYVR